MNKLCVVGLAALVTVTACDGLKEAMTAHVDVAARAGSQELSVQRLGDLMGKSQVPLRKDVAQQIADVWVNYQLAAKAAAEGETFKDTTILDKAMSPIFARSRQDKWYQVVSASGGEPHSFSVASGPKGLGSRQSWRPCRHLRETEGGIGSQTDELREFRGHGKEVRIGCHERSGRKPRCVSSRENDSRILQGRRGAQAG